MGSAARDGNGLRAHGTEGEDAGVPVILDGGGSAHVAVIDFGREPQVGMRFEHAGRTWELTRAKDYARGWVARPVRPRILL